VLVYQETAESAERRDGIHENALTIKKEITATPLPRGYSAGLLVRSKEIEQA
jgi:hypothetical protein